MPKRKGTRQSGNLYALIKEGEEKKKVRIIDFSPKPFREGDLVSFRNLITPPVPAVSRNFNPLPINKRTPESESDKSLHVSISSSTFPNSQPFSMFNIDYHYDPYGNYHPQPLPPLLDPPNYLPPIQVAPMGYLQPAPADPPLRPAFLLDQEHLIFRIEGFLVGVILIFGLLFYGKMILFLGLVAVLAGVYWYCDWRGDVLRFRAEEEFRRDGRLLPVQPQQQHYVIQPPLLL